MLCKVKWIVSNGVNSTIFHIVCLFYVDYIFFGVAEVISWLRFYVGSNEWGQIRSNPKNFQIASLFMSFNMFFLVGGAEVIWGVKFHVGSNWWGQKGSKLTIFQRLP